MDFSSFGRRLSIGGAEREESSLIFGTAPLEALW